jgi:hypothetical protein
MATKWGYRAVYGAWGEGKIIKETILVQDFILLYLAGETVDAQKCRDDMILRWGLDLALSVFIGTLEVMARHKLATEIDCDGTDGLMHHRIEGG